MFSGLRDSLTSSAVKSLIASKVSRYGKLTDLRIRSRERTIVADLALEGEETAVRIEVSRYTIKDIEGQTTLIIEEVSASRVWVSRLLEDLLPGRPIPIPSVAMLALGGVEETAVKV